MVKVVCLLWLLLFPIVSGFGCSKTPSPEQVVTEFLEKLKQWDYEAGKVLRPGLQPPAQAGPGIPLPNLPLYRFIVSRFKKLQSGEIKMSDLTRDDRKMILKDEYCVYCGSTENLTFDHIIPLSRGGPDITSNLVLACKRCNSSKCDKDIFYWYAIERQEEIPKLVLSKYLKLVYDYHEKNGTLDRTDLNEDGKLDVMWAWPFLRSARPRGRGESQEQQPAVK